MYGFSVVTVALCFSGVVVLGMHTHHHPGKLPASFPRCSKKDPNLDMCLKKALEVVLPKLYQGEPSLGVFPLDPLKVTYMDIGGKKGGSVAINIIFRDLLIKGLSSIKLNSVKTDLNNYKIVFKADLMSPLLLEGKYEANGRILIIPIGGKGNCKLKLDNIKALLVVDGEEKMKEGLKYMGVKDVKLDFNTTRLHLHFDSLLGTHADGLVGDNLNSFLNQNWKDILDDLKPGIEDALGATFQEIASRVFSRVPFDQIFL